MLSVTIKSNMLNVVMMTAVMLNVIMLNVMAPARSAHSLEPPLSQ